MEREQFWSMEDKEYLCIHLNFNGDENLSEIEKFFDCICASEGCKLSELKAGGKYKARVRVRPCDCGRKKISGEAFTSQVARLGGTTFSYGFIAKGSVTENTDLLRCAVSELKAGMVSRCSLFAAGDHVLFQGQVVGREVEWL